MLKLDVILTEGFLREHYIERKESVNFIGKLVGCDNGAIISRLERFDIKVKRNKKRNLKKGALVDILTKDYLVDKYISSNLGTKEIGELVGCGICSVRFYLRKHGIKVRSVSEQKKGKKLSEAQCVHLRKVRKGKAKRGSESHSWKGGISPLRLMIGNSQEYKDWRTSIYERDNYTCQDCGVRGGKLEAHHLKAFAIILQEFLRHYSQFSPIEDKETLLRLTLTYPDFWDLENGQTLCKECHNKTKLGKVTLSKTEKGELETCKVK